MAHTLAHVRSPTSSLCVNSRYAVHFNRCCGSSTNGVLSSLLEFSSGPSACTQHITDQTQSVRMVPALTLFHYTIAEKIISLVVIVICLCVPSNIPDLQHFHHSINPFANVMSPFPIILSVDCITLVSTLHALLQIMPATCTAYNLLAKTGDR